jgi:hypothetical protein
MHENVNEYTKTKRSNQGSTRHVALPYSMTKHDSSCTIIDEWRTEVFIDNNSTKRMGRGSGEREVKRIWKSNDDNTSRTSLCRYKIHSQIDWLLLINQRTFVDLLVGIIRDQHRWHSHIFDIIRVQLLVGPFINDCCISHFSSVFDALRLSIARARSFSLSLSFPRCISRSRYPNGLDFFDQSIYLYRFVT